MKEQQNIDNLFKDGLENPDLEYNELDWQAMEKKLDGRPRRIITLYWVASVSAIAALLLVCFFIWKPVENIGRSFAARKSKTKSSITSDSIKKSSTVNVAQMDELKAGKNILVPGNLVTKLDGSSKNSLEYPAHANKLIDNPIEGSKLANINLETTNLIVNFESATPVELKINSDIPVSGESTSKRTNSHKRPQLSLGVLVAPDLTSVQRSGRSSLSGGLGLEATLGITKRLSITTGATYSKKIYNSDFNLYNPQSNYVFKNQPDNIHAICDVVDIPLNVNYKLVENTKNTVIITTGLSSYLMLKEKYNYTYQNPNAGGPASYQVNNQNQHFLGVVNISATFKRKINGRLNIGFTPFVKIPLTNIGYGNTKLSSTGVAISLNVPDIFNKN